MTRKLKINLAALDAAIEEQLKVATTRYAAIATQIITQARDWEDLGNRDIVETGQLRASQRIDRLSATEYRLFYTANYATWVHEGYTMRNGRRIVGRPWLTLAKDQLLRELKQKR